MRLWVPLSFPRPQALFPDGASAQWNSIEVFRTPIEREGHQRMSAAVQGLHEFLVGKLFLETPKAFPAFRSSATRSSV